MSRVINTSHRRGGRGRGAQIGIIEGQSEEQRAEVAEQRGRGVVFVLSVLRNSHLCRVGTIACVCAAAMTYLIFFSINHVFLMLIKSVAPCVW